MREILDRFHPIQEQLETLLANPDSARQRFPYSYKYLPDILGALKILQGCLKQEPLNWDECGQIAGALGRVALEHTDLPESDLGKQLLQLVSRVIKLAKASSEGA